MEGGLVWQGINFKYECSWLVCTLCDIASLQQTNLIWLARPTVCGGTYSVPTPMTGRLLREYRSDNSAFTVIDLRPYPTITCFDKTVNAVKVKSPTSPFQKGLQGGCAKKGGTCFGSKCEAGCDDGTAVCEPIILYCCALHSLTMKA